MSNDNMLPVLITARLKSTRLERKVLLEVGGKPLMLHQLERLQNLNKCWPVVVTSDLASDNAIADFSRMNGVDCFRGSATNVLARYLACMDLFDFESAYILYADEPCSDLQLIQKSLLSLQSAEVDWVDNSNQIDGTFGYGILKSSLAEVCNNFDTSELEVWGPLFHASGLRKKSFSLGSAFRKSEIRLSIDYKSDLEMFSKLLSLVANFSEASIEEICQTYIDFRLGDENLKNAVAYDKRIKDQGRLAKPCDI